jgi:Arc/MetJ-type ribon-helix-helix transcriptional regulator
MTITLNPEQEKLIARAMQEVGYRNSDDVIARALELLRDEDNWLQEQRGAVSSKIERAVEQFAQGKFFDAEGSRMDMQRRKEAWLRERQ